MKRIQVSALLIVCLWGSLSADAADSLDYKPACQQIQRAWLELYKLPTQAMRDLDKKNLRTALENLYRAQGKDMEANFIENASDNDFADQIARIESGIAATFPAIQKPDRYNVSKQKSGTLTFVPLWGCTGAYSIPPRSPYYRDACQLVGEMKVGDVKTVPAPAFEKWLTSNERVVMPDSN